MCEKKNTKRPLFNKVNGETLKQRLLESNEERTTISFYKYFAISNPQDYRNELFIEWQDLGVFGRIYLAKEGINAQLSLPTENLEQFKKQLYAKELFDGLRLNVAVEDDGKSFFKLQIKVRPKIVADGIEDETFDPSKMGKHLSAQEFNTLTDDENTILVDMRNHYESEVGHFKGAILPDCDTFREELPVVEDMLSDNKDKNIVMYCTGGIRCEKASAYMKHKGFENIYQLEGGIIKYAKDAKEQGLDNKFIGKNFVFDQRVGERISEEVISHCHQCGAPSDLHINCANDACHILFIQCEKCAESYEQCCSVECRDFRKLPKEEQKAFRRGKEFGNKAFNKGRLRPSIGENLIVKSLKERFNSMSRKDEQ
jgi:UPF0176 protein